MHFMDSEREQAVIKVIGVGGCGGNVVHYLQERRLAGVSYAAVNTDAQALGGISEGVECVHIGRDLTAGLGAGANPDIARQAAETDTERLRTIVQGCDMVFITAGMGKGTGTGASPIVAKICREAGALTVAVVTRPFDHERSKTKAQDGIIALEEYVDSLIIVPNSKLHMVLGDEATVDEALTAANDVLYNAVSGISGVITQRGEMNLDFNDVRSVMSKKGNAVIGSARAGGKDRAIKATEEALRCPLMEDVDLSRARGVLTSIAGSRKQMKLAEINKMQEVITESIPGDDDSQFFGVFYDEEIGDDLRVTIVVTGINAKGEPSLEVIQDGVTDGAFTSGRQRHQKNAALQKFGDDETKVPAILRKQVS
ncbi:MAG: cell division protein FtsZ [Gammaproteobacteria bacterium]